MISQNTIDQIKEVAKVADVVSDFIKLNNDLSAKCPFHKDDSPSFKIHKKENFYKCFGCGASGDSIEFLIKYKSWNYQQSIEYLAKKYNVLMESAEDAKKYTKPPEWQNVTSLSNNLVEWFKKRGISQKTLIQMNIGEGIEWMPHKQKELNTVQYNYFKNGERVNIKYRSGDKGMKLFKGGELIFYNLDSLKNAKECFICEGENDALALIECGVMKEGVAVLSVPNGANIKSNNLTYLDSAMVLFDKVEKIYLATDDDTAGRKLREDLSERFGKERCYYLEWKKEKDANDVLIKYGQAGVIECCNDKKDFPLEGIFNISDYDNAIDDMYTKGIDKGVGIGLKKFDDYLRFVKGWITVITGQPSSGKSDWTDQMVLGLMINHGWKAAFYSPENDPFELHFSKLARKLIGKSWYGKNKINEQEKNLCKKFLQDKLYIIKPKEDFSLDSIIESVLRLKQQKGIDCFIIDAWNRLDHKYSGANEAKYVQESLMKLDHFCRSRNIHCFLVAHPTKLEPDKRSGEYPVVRMYNISGGAHFRNIAANGISVHRDFKKQITEIHIQKVKFIPYWGQMGCIEMKYDLESGRFNESNAEGTACIFDHSNWITKENRQATIADDEENNNIIPTANPIIVADGEESPF